MFSDMLANMSKRRCFQVTGVADRLLYMHRHQSPVSVVSWFRSGLLGSRRSGERKCGAAGLSHEHGVQVCYLAGTQTCASIVTYNWQHLFLLQNSTVVFSVNLHSWFDKNNLMQPSFETPMEAVRNRITLCIISVAAT